VLPTRRVAGSEPAAAPGAAAIGQCSGHPQFNPHRRSRQCQFGKRSNRDVRRGYEVAVPKSITAAGAHPAARTGRRSPAGEPILHEHRGLALYVEIRRIDKLLPDGAAAVAGTHGGGPGEVRIELFVVRWQVLPSLASHAASAVVEAAGPLSLPPPARGRPPRNTGAAGGCAATFARSGCKVHAG
jgi:hypothetical protein